MKPLHCSFAIKRMPICRKRQAIWKVFLTYVVLTVVFITTIQILGETKYPSRLMGSNSGKDPDNFWTEDYSPDLLTLTLEALDQRIPADGEFYQTVPSFLSKQTINYKADDEQDGDVTLVCHGTDNRILSVVNITTAWPGPISVALLQTKPSLLLLTSMTIKTLQRCHPAVKNKVSFHVTFPRKFSYAQIDTNLLIPNISEMSCTDALNALKERSEKHHTKQNFEEEEQYPQNIMRNIGWKTIATWFVFTIDIDIIPNSGLYHDFREFVRNNPYAMQTDQVFVVPAFEKRIHIAPPRTKAEVQQEYNRSNVRQFYLTVYKPSHTPTNYDRWMYLNANETFGVGYDIEYVNRWEPFFIVKKTAPKFDERFIRYGFDRVSHMCELYMAGFKFSVLNNAFVMHDSFKTNEKFHANKFEELKLNQRKFRNFLTDMNVKYAGTNRSCH